MFKQLEPALEFDDGKLLNKSISRNRDGLSCATPTNDSVKNPSPNNNLQGGEYSFSEHLEANAQQKI